jgi:hypothetical protein
MSEGVRMTDEASAQERKQGAGCLRGCCLGCGSVLVVVAALILYVQLAYRVNEENRQYVSSAQGTPYGVVFAALTATQYRSTYSTLNASPYELLICLEPQSSEELQVQIVSMGLQGLDSEVIYSEGMGRVLAPARPEATWYCTEIQGLHLPEEDLVLNTVIRMGPEAAPEEVALVFEFKFEVQRGYWNAIWGPLIT